jgi:hypothetical protein
MPTVCELRIAAKAKGLRGYSKMNKARLTELLAPAKPKPTPLSASGSARRVKKAPAKKEPVKQEPLKQAPASLSSADWLAQKFAQINKPKPKPKTVSKEVIAVFYNGHYDRWAITADGEVLSLRKSKQAVVISKHENIKDAFNSLLKEEKGNLQTGVHTYNQLHYTWKEGDELKDYGLTMAVPSASILKIFYTTSFKKDKDDTDFYYIHEKVKDKRYASFRQHMEEEREKEGKKK